MSRKNASRPEQQSDPFQRIYQNMNDRQRDLFFFGLEALENNERFMEYVHRHNQSDEDAASEYMYRCVNYKMGMMCAAIRANTLKMQRNTYTILEIGCGTGYFAYLSRLLGSNVYALDVEDVAEQQPLFAQGQAILGLNMIPHTIQEFQPLPVLPEKVSLVVTFSPHFYNPSKETFWQAEAWTFFLTDLAKNMTENGWMFWEMNHVVSAPEFGVFGSAETKALFLHFGARVVDGYRVFFDSMTKIREAARSSASVGA